MNTYKCIMYIQLGVLLYDSTCMCGYVYIKCLHVPVCKLVYGSTRARVCTVTYMCDACVNSPLYIWLRVTATTDSFVRSGFGNRRYGLCLL